MEGSYGPRLASLRISNLRNLRCLTLDLDGRAGGVLVTGSNGAGKTTVLEALYLLARGRSFRGRKAGGLTTDGELRTVIEGRLEEPGCPGESVVVFERTAREAHRRFNGIAIKGQSPQESPLRVKLVGENPQSLLDGEPALRRALLDWNVFHVERQLGRLRADLRRVLNQRNAALRRVPRGMCEWDGVFVELSEQITAKRRAFVNVWRSHFLGLSRGFTFLDGCDLVYTQGWPPDSDLFSVLERSRTMEVARGQTLAGPHRADLTIARDDLPLRLSRGQAKVAVCLLQVAAERVHLAEGLPPSLWLLDDLEAELDSVTAGQLMQLYAALAGQRFMTRIGSGEIRVTDIHAGCSSMFHVEHAGAHPPIQEHSNADRVPSP
jgi:DNA replication and repair protein RecF